MTESYQSGVWAAQVFCNTYRSGEHARDERMIEEALVLWLKPMQNRHRFLRALGQPVDPMDEITFRTQLKSEDDAKGRVDLTFDQAGDPVRVELKLLASLTSAQTQSDYADIFLVPASRRDHVTNVIESGAVVSWEELFSRLTPDAGDSALEQLRGFYEGVAYGLTTSGWDSPNDTLLRAFRATARALLGEAVEKSGFDQARWDPDDWFTWDAGRKALDPTIARPWWSRKAGGVWERGSSEGARIGDDVTAFAGAAGDLWKAVVRSGLRRSNDGKSRVELEAHQFGRQFEICDGSQVAVMLTVDDYDDDRLIGLVVRSNDGATCRDAWWPASFDRYSHLEWRSELMTVASKCADGDSEHAFANLTHAVR